MFNQVNFLKPVKYSMFVGFLFANTMSYAGTVNFNEYFNGTFTSNAFNNVYSLSSNADGTFPTLTSVGAASPCGGSIGCAGTGSFFREESNTDSFFGSFDFIVDDYYFFNEDDESIYVYEIKYSGNLNITGGTGSYAGATGGGIFDGKDSYYAIFADSLGENANARFLPTPNGDVKQSFLWTVTTPDINEVPVPAAAWLFGTSLLGFAGFRRKLKLWI